jgi:hypothetical protein
MCYKLREMPGLILEQILLIPRYWKEETNKEIISASSRAVFTYGLKLRVSVRLCSGIGKNLFLRLGSERHAFLYTYILQYKL